jgi:hypothetical protein
MARTLVTTARRFASRVGAASLELAPPPVAGAPAVSRRLWRIVQTVLLFFLFPAIPPRARGTRREESKAHAGARSHDPALARSRG